MVSVITFRTEHRFLHQTPAAVAGDKRRAFLSGGEQYHRPPNDKQSRLVDR